VGEILGLDALAAPASGGVHGAAAPATPGGPGAASPRNAEPNAVVGACTQVLVETMVEVFERSGYRELRADVPNHAAPDLVRGTMRSHRPSLAAVVGDCAVLVDVFVPGETAPEEQISRWHLFASAAAQVGGEFHVVVPARVDGVDGRSWAHQLADAAGLAIHHVWEI
jgi:hypothetical protein